MVNGKSDQPTVNKEQQMRQSFWRWFGEAMGLTNNQPRHPIEGKFQGKPGNAARRGFAEMHDMGKQERVDEDAGADLEGTQTTPDGHMVAKLTEEDADDFESDPKKAEYDNEDAGEEDYGDFDPEEHEREPAQLYNWGRQQGKPAKPKPSVASGSNEAVRRQQAQMKPAAVPVAAKPPAAPKPATQSPQAQPADDHGGMASVNPNPTELAENCEKTMPHNQFGSGSVADHEQVASRDAATASMVSPDHRKPALQALDHASDGNSGKAADAHLAAAKMHEKSAVAAHKDKEPMQADQHMMAAGLHRKAAAMHQAVKNQALLNANPEGHNQYGGGSGSKAHDASEKANEESMLAGESHSKDAHEAAALAHGKAAKLHEKEGNKNGAEWHASMASLHKETAKSATHNQGETEMLTREQMLSKLTANCSCEGDKAAFNNLSDAALTQLTSNKFPPNFMKKKKGEEDDEDDDEDEEDGEMADNDKEMHSFDDGPVKAGSEQAGGKGTKDEYNKAGVKNRRVVEEWLKSAPAPVANAVRLAMAHEKQVKLGIIHRLIANVSDVPTRNRIGNKLLGESLPELQERLMMAGPTQNRQEVDSMPSYFGAQDSPSDTTVNAADEGDVLVPPTLNFQEISGLTAKDFERRNRA